MALDRSLDRPGTRQHHLDRAVAQKLHFLQRHQVGRVCHGHCQRRAFPRNGQELVFVHQKRRDRLQSFHTGFHRQRVDDRQPVLAMQLRHQILFGDESEANKARHERHPVLRLMRLGREQLLRRDRRPPQQQIPHKRRRSEVYAFRGGAQHGRRPPSNEHSSVLRSARPGASPPRRLLCVADDRIGSPPRRGGQRAWPPPWFLMRSQYGKLREETVRA